MHLGDVSGGRNLSGADRPDGFVGHDQFAPAPRIGQGGRQLPGDDLERTSRLTLRFALAHADDRQQASAEGRFGLRPDLFVGLMLVGPPLGMADDRHAGARLDDHGNGDATRMGAALACMAVLRTDGEVRRPGSGGRDEGEGRANAHIDVRMRPGGGGDQIKLAERCDAPVHLPVSDDQFAAHKALLLSELFSGAISGRAGLVEREGRPAGDPGFRAGPTRFKSIANLNDTGS